MTSRDTQANSVTSAKSARASAPTEGTYYYYYINNNETLQPPRSAVYDEQQQNQQQQPTYNNDIAGNYYYYYTTDGTSDPNYNDFYIQPAGNYENYNSQRIINNWR